MSIDLSIDFSLIRTSYTTKGVTGQIVDRHGLPICSSLELPWSDNERNISCVPTGLYDIKLDTRHRGKVDECLVWELMNVKGKRTECQFHIANWCSELLGCIALVSSLTMLHDKLFGASSRDAFEKLMAYMKQKKFGKILISNRGRNSEKGDFYV